MVDAAVSLAVEKLGKFIAGKLDFLTEVRTNAEWLRDELAYMQEFLKNAEEKRGNHLVGRWISDIDNIAQETVSVLEEFTHADAGGGRHHDDIGCDFMTRCRECVRYYACLCNKQPNMFDIGEKMLALRRRVEELCRRRETYEFANINGMGGEESSSALKVRELRRTTSYMEQGNRYTELADVKSVLIDELLKEDSRRCVVSIHGAGGLGKTSLAQRLYNSYEISSQFHSRAWIYVSQVYNTPGLLRSLIKSLEKDNRCNLEMVQKMDLDDLERYVRNLLKERYIVVVDDVWKMEAWLSLKRALPDYGNGSRVIVTTRNKHVATQMDDNVVPHTLRLLDLDESWDVFYGKLCQGDGHVGWCSADMQELGRQMVTKCKGLPLALIVLGGLLARKKTLKQWQKVKKRIWKDLANDSIEITHLFSLSYDNLSTTQLRRCFLYLATYPEDFSIDTQKLMWLWIAEGFIPQGDEMEDVAQSYLDELCNGGLTDMGTTVGGHFATCKIHDILRDLAMEKAIDVGLFDVYRDGAEHSTSFKSQRHVVDTQMQGYLSMDHSNTRLQSLILMDHTECHVNPELWYEVGKYKHLCVLKLFQVKLPEEMLHTIVYLTKLKYLDLKRTGVVALPPSIGNLISLQTLMCDDSCELPPETSKLTSLRHLAGGFKDNVNLGALSNLRFLGFVNYEKWNTAQTESLVNLRVLMIYNVKEQNGNACFLESISKLTSLESLFLNFSLPELSQPLDFSSSLQNLHSLVLQGNMRMLPPIDKWPSSVTSLCLTHTQLEEDPTPILEKLPNLRSLCLRRSHNSSTMVFYMEGFPQLEILKLVDMYGLKTLILEEGAAPRINFVLTRRCPQLKDIPEKFKTVLVSD